VITNHTVIKKMMNNILNKNEKLFSSNVYYSTDDFLLKPTTGVLKTRKDAVLDSPFIYSSPMDTVTSLSMSQALLDSNQSPVFCRFLSDEIQALALERFSTCSNFWFSVSSSLEDYDALKLYFSDKLHAVNISVDVAHGDTKHLNKIYNLYAQASWCSGLMSGTVATSTSAIAVARAGCTHVRVGIGPGSACSTRVITGCGVPNISAVFDVWSSFQIYPESIRPKIIADGGIRTTGDIVKYLSAGANGVMIGRLFSNCIESSGWKTNRLKKLINFLSFNLFFKRYLYKRYRGQASKDFQLEHRGVVSGTPEGVVGSVQYPKNTVDNFVTETKAGVASALSYLGLTNIKDLNPYNVEFIHISPASYRESRPHLLD
jgi:IMP dehydrogenase/GMP reductase